MKYIPIILLFVSFAANAQPTAVVESFQNIAGQPFFPKQYTDVNGTPYLFEDWTTSTITLNDGKVIKNIKTNFNLVTNELLYLETIDKIMIASPSVVKSVETGDRKFITTAGSSYFEVLSTEGKAMLLRHSKKVIMETKPYNSATIQKNFSTSESHVLLVGGNVTEVKNANDIYDALVPAEPLKDYAKKEKLKSKSVNSWVKIVDYYNSI